MIPKTTPFVKTKSPCISYLIDQAVEKQERHIAAAAWHWDRAERARLIRAELERMIPIAVGTAVAWEVCHD